MRKKWLVLVLAGLGLGFGGPMRHRGPMIDHGC